MLSTPQESLSAVIHSSPSSAYTNVDTSQQTSGSTWSSQGQKGLLFTPAGQLSSLPTPPTSPGSCYWSPTAKKGLISTPSKIAYGSQDTDSNARKGFVEPDLNIAYAIDHATTNPDNSHRLATPYPAPQDILIASRSMYAANVARITQLKAQNVPEEQRRLPWTIFEDDQVIKYMLEVNNDPSIKKTEARFVEIARRMEADGLEPRSKISIKNMWCRIGRGRSGFDERKGVRRDPRFAVNKWKASDDSPKKRKKYNVTPNKRKIAEEIEDVEFEL